MNDRVNSFRTAITDFIEDRRQRKEKDKNYDASKFEYSFWLEDAARRVAQIHAVTHVLKATHSDAKGSSLYLKPADLPLHSEVGSHVLGDDFADDVVGNAAALDVYRFLRTEVAGQRLFDWVLAEDVDLRAALSPDDEVADTLMQAFASLVAEDEQPASDTRAKQVYWAIDPDPTLDENFHLLQPLFSSSLAHKVHTDIQEARFGEENKEARAARRNNAPHEHEYQNYLGLAVRKLGGSNTQNVSQLNNARGGVNYLLSSVPPVWNDKQRIRTFKVSSILDGFYWFGEVRELVKTLAKFLLSDPDPTVETREYRQKLVQSLSDQLALFGDSIRFDNVPGWTRSPECQLPLHQKIWLDLERMDLPSNESSESEDAEFRAAYEFDDWPDQVAADFARWLNAQLRKAGLKAVGDTEYTHWARQAVLEELPLTDSKQIAVGDEI